MNCLAGANSGLLRAVAPRPSLSRFVLLCAGALALPSLAEDVAEQPAVKARLAVVPFASLSGEVPSRAGAKAQGMLATEFKSADSFTLLETAGKAKASADAQPDELAEARKAVDEAKALRGKRKFRLADEALQRALTTYKASAAALPEVGELVDTWALASAVAYNTGRDEEGAKYLAQALALAPDRELPLAQTSPLFAKVVAEARKSVKAQAHGTVVLETAPSNVPVTVDGVGLGASPLAVKDVPVGQHVWSAHLPSGEVVGGVIDVPAGKSVTAKGQSASKDPESRLLVSLAQNRLDAEVLAAAKDTAKAADADFVVFGALSKDGKGLALDTFLFAASSGEIRRLPRAQFDPELLSAGMEFYNIAGELAKKGDKVGEGVKVPSSVSLTPLVAGPKVAEAKYGVEPGKDAALEVLEAETATTKEPADGQRKPVDAQKRRVPLKKQ